MRELEFRMLGPLEVRADGALLDLGGEGWERALLARLLLDANRTVSADQLVDDLCGESPSRTAMAVLMNAISALRRTLGTDTVVTRPPGFELRLDWTRTDIHRFERLASAGRKRLAAGHSLEAAETLRLALDLWRGEPFEELAGEAWARAEIGRLRELRLVTIEDQIDAGLAIGSPAVLPMLERYVVHYPRRGRLRGQLVAALHNAGREDESIAALMDAHRFFTDVAGVDTAPLRNELRALMSYAPAEPQPKVQPTDATAHLFDEWAFRLGRGEWPNPRDYLERAGDHADELRRLMDGYIRALPRPAPAHEDVERAQAWLAAAQTTDV